jgi:hypothetical protein
LVSVPSGIMNTSAFIIALAVIGIIFSSCKRPLDPKMLAGKWNYVKVENPYSPNPPDTISARELAENKPYIRLSENGVLLMMWGGKVLSHGTYKIGDKDNINYTEEMPDGKTRTFPFWIKELTDKEIIFETKEEDAVRVVAKKE